MNQQFGRKAGQRMASACLLGLVALAGCSSAEDRLRDAAARGDAPAVEAALDQRVNLEEPDDSGATPLLLAVQRAQQQTAELLLSRGASPRAALPDGTTALALAALSANTPIVRLLLVNHAEVTATDTRGRTALMQAAGVGAIDTVALLLAYGADAVAKDAAGLTAAAHARQAGHEPLARYLDNPFPDGSWKADTAAGDRIAFDVKSNRLIGSVRIRYQYSLSNPYGPGVLFARCRLAGQQPAEDAGSGIAYSGAVTLGERRYSCAALSSGGQVDLASAMPPQSTDLRSGHFEVKGTDEELLMNYANPFENRIDRRDVQVEGTASINGSVGGTLVIRGADGAVVRQTTWTASPQR